jgi:hypothetical protein
MSGFDSGNVGDHLAVNSLWVTNQAIPAEVHRFVPLSDTTKPVRAEVHHRTTLNIPEVGLDSKQRQIEPLINADER